MPRSGTDKFGIKSINVWSTVKSPTFIWLLRIGRRDPVACVDFLRPARLQIMAQNIGISSGQSALIGTRVY